MVRLTNVDEEVEHLFNAASISCGSIFAGYLGVRVGTDASIASYFNVLSLFLAAIIIVMTLSILSHLLARREYANAAKISVFYVVSIAGLTWAAIDLPVDIGVLLCVIAAWSVVPLGAAYWGIKRTDLPTE